MSDGAQCLLPWKSCLPTRVEFDKDDDGNARTDENTALYPEISTKEDET